MLMRLEPLVGGEGVDLDLAGAGPDGRGAGDEGKAVVLGKGKDEIGLDIGVSEDGVGYVGPMLGT